MIQLIDTTILIFLTFSTTKN